MTVRSELEIRDVITLIVLLWLLYTHRIIYVYWSILCITWSIWIEMSLCFSHIVIIWLQKIWKNGSWFGLNHFYGAFMSFMMLVVSHWPPPNCIVKKRAAWTFCWIFPCVLQKKESLERQSLDRAIKYIIDPFPSLALFIKCVSFFWEMIDQFPFIQDFNGLKKQKQVFRDNLNLL